MAGYSVDFTEKPAEQKSFSLVYDEKAYDLRKRFLGIYSKDMAITYLALTEDYLNFNKNDKAKECIIKAEEMQLAVIADEKILQERLSERDVLTRFEKENQSKRELDFMEKGVRELGK